MYIHCKWNNITNRIHLLSDYKDLWNRRMASRKKVLLKVIILGDSGYVHDVQLKWYMYKWFVILLCSYRYMAHFCPVQQKSTLKNYWQSHSLLHVYVINCCRWQLPFPTAVFPAIIILKNRRDIMNTHRPPSPYCRVVSW